MQENQTDYKNIRIFKGLNSLRFIAACLVVIQHCEGIKRNNGIENFEHFAFFKNGTLAVTFFFVLSGFLITYLLLKELDKTGTINIKKFYLKRILRIWPLYFLLVFIGTIALPVVIKMFNISYTMPYTLEQTWFYFLLFMPGLITYYFGHHFLEPLWSIGVEVFFYLIWAPLLKLFKNKILLFLISVIIIKSLLGLLSFFIDHNVWILYITRILKFEAMAIGGIGAYFIYTKGYLINKLFLFKKPVQVLLFSTIIAFLVFRTQINNPLWKIIFKTPILSALFVEFLFVYLIICISVVNNSIIKLRSKTLSFLGEISYGIYMYHILVIFISVYFLKKYLVQITAPWNHLLFYFVVMTITIMVSALSKYFFENYFLNLKERIGNKKT